MAFAHIIVNNMSPPPTVLPNSWLAIYIASPSSLNKEFIYHWLQWLGRKKKLKNNQWVFVKYDQKQSQALLTSEFLVQESRFDDRQIKRWFYHPSVWIYSSIPFWENIIIGAMDVLSPRELKSSQKWICWLLLKFIMYSVYFCIFRLFPKGWDNSEADSEMTSLWSFS